MMHYATFDPVDHDLTTADLLVTDAPACRELPRASGSVIAAYAIRAGATACNWYSNPIVRRAVDARIAAYEAQQGVGA